MHTQEHRHLSCLLPLMPGVLLLLLTPWPTQRCEAFMMGLC